MRELDLSFLKYSWMAHMFLPARVQNETRKLVAFFLGFLAMLFVVCAFPQGHFVLVITNPGSSQDRIMQVISSADGLFVSSGSRPWMAIAYSESNDFAQRLMRSGAWLVLNHALATGCFQKDR